jgi:hypothetical protein
MRAYHLHPTSQPPDQPANHPIHPSQSGTHVLAGALLVDEVGIVCLDRLLPRVRRELLAPLELKDIHVVCVFVRL